jgi:hypothetical protein
MKKSFYSLIAIFLLFVSCDKDNPSDNTEDNVIVGGVYKMYTEVIVKPFETKVYINDSIYTFNKVEAYYGSYKPTSNNNIFMVNVIDTTQASDYVMFEVFTSFIEPESFFNKDSFLVEKIRIERGGVREDFDNVNTFFYWDDVSYDNLNFSGKARLKIPNEITGKLNPDISYPKQELKFEF